MTNEYKGLNQVEDCSYVFRLEIKKVREEQSIMEENYKEQSEEIGRDIRFP